MDRKGFTLIELLAVIVILAAIALIVTPLVLSTINTSKVETYKRSIDMYARAIKTAASLYDLSDESGESVTVEKLKSLNLIKYEGSKVECETEIINEDGSVYLAACKVDGKEVDYVYGTEEKKPTPMEKIVYRWSNERKSIGDTLSESEYTSDASTLGTNYYLKHILDSNNRIEHSYVCAMFSVGEYCLEGGNESHYGDENTGNVKILKDLQSKGLSCNFPASSSHCSEGLINLGSNSSGAASVLNSGNNCAVDEYGSSYCEELNIVI